MSCRLLNIVSLVKRPVRFLVDLNYLMQRTTERSLELVVEML